MKMLLVAVMLLAGDAKTNEKEAHDIGALLRCPVCQGMPISESPSEMAQAMMGRVREMQAEGKSRTEIIDYFTQRYGDWVLLEPRKEGINILVWTLPPVALLLGVLAVLRYTRRNLQTKAPPPVPPSAKSDDPYLAAVRREVEQ